MSVSRMLPDGLSEKARVFRPNWEWYVWVIAPLAAVAIALALPTALAVVEGRWAEVAGGLIGVVAVVAAATVMTRLLNQQRVVLDGDHLWVRRRPGWWLGPVDLTRMGAAVMQRQRSFQSLVLLQAGAGQRAGRSGALLPADVRLRSAVRPLVKADPELRWLALPYWASDDGRLLVAIAPALLDHAALDPRLRRTLSVASGRG